MLRDEKAKESKEKRDIKEMNGAIIPVVLSATVKSG